MVVTRQTKWSQTPKGRYTRQMVHARERNILWQLSFDQWWTLWLESGHWEQRGTRWGQFHMAREGDKGPYAIGNVSIIRMEQNVSEARKQNQLPIGVTRRNGKFLARTNRKHLGSFTSIKAAKQAYQGARDNFGGIKEA